MSSPTPPAPEYLAETSGPIIRGAIWTATSVALVTVVLRCYTRIWLRSIFGVDDALIILSMAVLLAYSAVIEVAVRHGLGGHIEYVVADPQSALIVALLGQISQPLVIMSCAIGKTSFAVTLMRVAAQRWIHITLWFIVWTMNVLHVLVSVFVFARCESPRATWDQAVESRCWSHERYLSFTLFIGSTDFALALLPWAMLWHLNMKKGEKGGVALAMSLGVFAGIVAIVKTVHLAGSASDPDITWAVAPLLWWAGTENGLIIIAACVPTLRPLLQKLVPFSFARGSSGNSHPLQNMSHSLNMFTPKSKQGQWSAIAEAEGGTARGEGGPDGHSERGMLRRSIGSWQTERGDVIIPPGPAQITKKTEFKVSYGENE